MTVGITNIFKKVGSQSVGHCMSLFEHRTFWGAHLLEVMALFFWQG